MSFVVSTSSPAVVLGVVLLGGWLADALASTDADVDRGIDAYEQGEHDQALEYFAAARERLGDRPEIQFDEGLAQLAKGDLEAARSSFERGTESDDLEIRASALYELGNMALQAEDFEGAIERYVACLKARPDHANAKWNLEIALQRKQEQENDDEDEQEDPEQDEERDTDGGDDGGDTDGEPADDRDTQGEPPPDESPQDDQPDEGGTTGAEPPSQGTDGSSESQEPEPPESEPSEPPEQDQEQAAPQPLDRMDIDRALDELDSQDNFQLGRPSGRRAPPEKDW